MSFDLNYLHMCRREKDSAYAVTMWHVPCDDVGATTIVTGFFSERDKDDMLRLVKHNEMPPEMALYEDISTFDTRMKSVVERLQQRLALALEYAEIDGIDCYMSHIIDLQQSIKKLRDMEPL